QWQNFMEEEIGYQTLLMAFSEGVRFLDTAPWYGRGRAERTIGKALKARQSLVPQMVLCTKIGRLYPDDDFDYSYDAAMRSFDASCERLGLRDLGLDHIHIVHLHDPMGQPLGKVMAPTGAFGAMQKLRQEGRIKYLGV